ncbi:MAG: methyltransferase domain-containing protein, partial [Deltaproteobacteria bacterium]|nr:methyltransferase domain-containing protein [Deltaproteobacteria bacterium]
GLFTVLGGRALRVETIAEKLALQVTALQRLLRVLVVLGLVENRGTAYANTALARTYLCRRSRSYMGDYFIHCDTLQEQWLRVKPALKTGKMVQPEQQRIADYPRQLTLFLAAMDALGRLKNPLIQKHIPPRSVSAMLDLGGGLGTHAVSYARRNKNLNAIVFDLKDVVPQARRYIKAAGAAERVRALAGEALSDALPPGPFDLVLIANVLHIYGADDCRALIRKAAGVLAAKGILLVHDYFFGIGDQLAAGLFDMTMLSGTPEGR